MPTSSSKVRSSGKDGGGRNSRTRRACDRCRLKKAKCHGSPRCETCKTSDSPCTYSIRRKIEARSYYSQMREVMDEALQQLYWACRQKSGFPGKVPDESAGVITTDEILKGLGLVEPSLKIGRYPCTTKRQANDMDTANSDNLCDQLRTSPAESDLTQNNPITVSPSSSDVSPSIHERNPACGASNRSLFPCEDNFNMETNTYPPSVGTLTQASIQDLNTPPYTAQSENSGHSSDSVTFADRNASQYTGLYTVTTGLRSADLVPEMKYCDTGQVEQMERRAFANYSAPEGIMRDRYLAPWPGSLAAAFQSVIPVGPAS